MAAAPESVAARVERKKWVPKVAAPVVEQTPVPVEAATDAPAKPRKAWTPKRSGKDDASS
jgi:hypothetical protein